MRIAKALEVSLCRSEDYLDLFLISFACVIGPFSQDLATSKYLKAVGALYSRNQNVLHVEILFLPLLVIK